MHLFYGPHIQGDTIELEEKESLHAIRVLRLAGGERVSVVDGRGGWYEALIVDDHPRRCRLQIESKTVGYQPLSYTLHLAVAPTKNLDRFEWFLEKATEIGISEITPLICRRSERSRVKMERLEKILVSAMKQSLKAFHPLLNDAKSFSEIIGSNFSGQKFIAYVEEGKHPLLQSLYNAGEDTLILIGPEGDFSPEEVQQAKENGFQLVSLGESRLRTETAGIVAVHTVAMLNNE